MKDARYDGTRGVPCDGHEIDGCTNVAVWAFKARGCRILTLCGKCKDSAVYASRVMEIDYSTEAIHNGCF